MSARPTIINKEQYGNNQSYVVTTETKNNNIARGIELQRRIKFRMSFL